MQYSRFILSTIRLLSYNCPRFSLLVQLSQADVYAIGVVYWALATGENPEEDTDYLDTLTTSRFDLPPSQR